MKELEFVLLRYKDFSVFDFRKTYVFKLQIRLKIREIYVETM